MPLVKQTLQTALKTEIEAQLKAEFLKPTTKEKLRKKLDGGPENGKKTDAVDINGALINIREIVQQLSTSPSTELVNALSQTEERIRKATANEWANGVSDSVCEWLSDTVAPIIADKLSAIIATNVDIYIKSATIIIPPGQAVATTPVPVTASPSPPALIS